jgi:hypothetical protein
MEFIVVAVGILVLLALAVAIGLEQESNRRNALRTIASERRRLFAMEREVTEERARLREVLAEQHQIENELRQLQRWRRQVEPEINLRAPYAIEPNQDAEEQSRSESTTHPQTPLPSRALPAEQPAIRTPSDPNAQDEKPFESDSALDPEYESDDPSAELNLVLAIRPRVRYTLSQVSSAALMPPSVARSTLERLIRKGVVEESAGRYRLLRQNV